MKKVIFNSKCTGFALALSLLPAPAFAAATLDDVVNALNKIYTFLDTTMMQKDWLGPQPNLQLTQTNNNLASKLYTATTTMTGGGIADQSALAVASVIGPNANPGIGPALLSYPAGDTYNESSPSATAQINANCGDNAFNFEMLMSPAVYGQATLPCAPVPQKISTYANAYIQFAAGLGNPISTYSINQLVSDNTLTQPQATKLSKSPEWQEFALARRTLLAQQSAGLSVLYYLAAQRTPSNASDPNSPSPESMASNVANWRTAPPAPGTDPSKTWYMQMQTALPAMVSRETLFVLAEMQRDLHAMRLENQRLMALYAVQELGMLNAGKTILGLKQSAVQNAVSLMLAPPPTNNNAAPTSTSGSSSTSGAASTTGTFDMNTGKYTPSASGAAAAQGGNKYTAPGTTP